jgi:hypothetical protein
MSEDDEVLPAPRWVTIFRDAVVSVAGVTVYDKVSADSLGRYIVAKIMKLPNGRTLTRQSYYRQRPAALRYARKFLEERAAKAGLTWSPGDGARTMAFHPIAA